MMVEVHLEQGPLKPAQPWRLDDSGAVMMFEGIVRPWEKDRPLVGLDYESYEPMTTQELRRLGELMVKAHALTGLRVEHSVGRVPAGECAFRLWIAALHRKETLAAMDEFIDRMKSYIPLWKIPVFADIPEEVAHVQG